MIVSFANTLTFLTTIVASEDIILTKLLLSETSKKILFLVFFINSTSLAVIYVFSHELFLSFIILYLISRRHFISFFINELKTIWIGVLCFLVWTTTPYDKKNTCALIIRSFDEFILPFCYYMKLFIWEILHSFAFCCLCADENEFCFAWMRSHDSRTRKETQWASRYYLEVTFFHTSQKPFRIVFTVCLATSWNEKDDFFHWHQSHSFFHRVSLYHISMNHEHPPYAEAKWRSRKKTSFLFSNRNSLLNKQNTLLIE